MEWVFTVIVSRLSLGKKFSLKKTTINFLLKFYLESIQNLQLFKKLLKFYKSDKGWLNLSIKLLLGGCFRNLCKRLMTK